MRHCGVARSVRSGSILPMLGLWFPGLPFRRDKAHGSEFNPQKGGTGFDSPGVMPPR
jgi:hypothetical protein